MTQQGTPKGDIFAEMAQRQKMLRDELKKAPIREIIGVVDASGAGGSNSKGQVLWTLRFEFKNWRYPGNEVQKMPLALSKEVTKDELGVIRGKIKPYDVFRIRAHVAEGGSSTPKNALLVEVVGKDNTDLELNGLAQQFQEPVTFEDGQFGIFRLDRRVNWYEANTTWSSKPARLTLRLEEDLDSEPSLKTARLLWNSQSDWDSKIYDCAVQKLLKIKNDSWLQAGEERITPEIFKDKMKLDAIIVAADGDFEFWFEDGDLFWGHSIKVDGNLSEGPTNAGIEG